MPEEYNHNNSRNTKDDDDFRKTTYPPLDNGGEWTNGMSPEHKKIVDEMIAELRALMGSGEKVDVSRKVNAGDGLKGGGELKADVTLAVSDDLMTKINDAGKGDYVPNTLLSVAAKGDSVVKRNSTGVAFGTDSEVDNALATVKRVKDSVKGFVNYWNTSKLTLWVGSASELPDDRDSNALYFVTE